ncbi:ATP-dependent helicase HrpB [Rubripirellula amarantea]|nr:ATP-dependent helicase HrpB [Rubripirellula amarantea]
MKSLPVTDVLPQIIAGLREDKAIVLKAPPGAGKTTAVPPAIIDAGVAGQGKVLLIQPRRLAARAAASRLATMMSTSLGDRVGYQVRFDNCLSPTTQLIAMTTGILLRRLQSDPLLEDVSCVLLDEFHERSVELDLALGMLHRIRTTFRPELKLVVMSATLDPQPIVNFLGDAVAIESLGRSFPVEVSYDDAASSERIETRVATTVVKLLGQTDGDVLVFLPGVGEIRRCASALESLHDLGPCRVHQLYGDLSPKDQDTVLGPSEFRKIILSTNVAETSVTIDGVTGVIDSGQARVMNFDSRLGLPKLQLEPISQASAEQRAGRAGRTAPGNAIRLWPRATHRSRRELDKPEVLRCDFSASLLLLANWGERDVEAFPWLTPPEASAVDLAHEYLTRCGAIDETGHVTPLGISMAKLPLPPRLSRFMVASAENGCIRSASILAALLSERDPFRGSNLSLLDRVEQIETLPNNRSSTGNIAGMKNVLRVAKQIERATELSASSIDADSDAIARSLLAAYPDRVARRRENDAGRAVMVGGRGLKLSHQVVPSDAELLIAIDVDSGSTEAIVRLGIAIAESWLDSDLITNVREHQYDRSLQAVIARQRRYFLDLLLAESPVKCEPCEEVAEILMTVASEDFSSVMPNGSKPLASFIERVNFIGRVWPDSDLPPIDDHALAEVARDLCRTRTKLSQLQSAPWLEHLHGRYSYEQLSMIGKQAPTRITVPSGNSVLVDYSSGKPAMAVRIQELFGWKSTPRIAGGRVPIQLQLLGPNYRPQQITEDLENFWAATYEQVRKELRRRYPKHHWPDDPFNAKATHNGLKPR